MDHEVLAVLEYHNTDLSYRTAAAGRDQKLKCYWIAFHRTKASKMEDVQSIVASIARLKIMASTDRLVTEIKAGDVRTSTDLRMNQVRHQAQQ
jgi:hypothetical protein